MKKIMTILYDLVSFVITLVYLPVYLFKRKFHKGFLNRLGFFPVGLKFENPIWIHAVSVGEALAVKNLIDELRRKYPDKQMVISTVTATGNKIAHAIARGNDSVIYFPLDFGFICRRVINKINPCMVIIAETEIWPNFISGFYNKHIPAVIVNSRISDKSFKGYTKIKFLVSPILNKISLFCSQTDTDARRLISLGADKDKVKITGNMKFDIPLLPFFKGGRRGNLQVVQVNDKLWVAASTHPGEEEIMLSAYKNLLARYPRLRLLIAPRHPERTPGIEKIVLSQGFNPIRISRLSANQAGPAVFILDTIGQLMDFYKIADVVFVGGSFIKKGGHNILEPAVLEKPIIFGQYMFNFRDIADLFIKHNAAILAHNQDDLEKALSGLLNNPQLAGELGAKAKALVEQNKGATARTAGYIESILTADKKQ